MCGFIRFKVVCVSSVYLETMSRYLYPRILTFTFKQTNNTLLLFVSLRDLERVDSNRHFPSLPSSRRDGTNETVFECRRLCVS